MPERQSTWSRSASQFEHNDPRRQPFLNLRDSVKYHDLRPTFAACNIVKFSTFNDNLIRYKAVSNPEHWAQSFIELGGVTASTSGLTTVPPLSRYSGLRLWIYRAALFVSNAWFTQHPFILKVLKLDLMQCLLICRDFDAFLYFFSYSPNELLNVAGWSCTILLVITCPLKARTS